MSPERETTMPASVLVAFATRYGSTREVADAIGAALREKGLTVDIQPARAVRSLEAYNAVVLGAPLYMFRWHADALRFLSRHRQALAARPTAVFALGPFHDDEKERRQAREQLDKALTKYAWFAPKAVEVFGGKFDPARLDFPYNLIRPLKQMPASDARDWAAIGAWAGSLATTLQTTA
jgi:menaquinone-dependent protoporphyrinogen oxidase